MLLKIEEVSLPLYKKAGVVTLNNPEKLNALTLEMCEGIIEAFQHWEYDDDIAFVLIKSSSEKAFCAGGDVSMVYYSVSGQLGNKYAYAEEFVETEYKMDYQLHQFPKPMIALGNGIVMGGGMGIFQACSHRVVSETSVLAMPENAIGLHTDVGAGYFYGRMPNKLGLFSGITGARLNAADAIIGNLTDYYIEKKYQENLIEKLLKATWAYPTETNMEIASKLCFEFNEKSIKSLPVSNFQTNEKEINEVLSQKNLQDMANKLNAVCAKNEWLYYCNQMVKYASPLALHCIYKQITECAYLPIKSCFERDYILSSNAFRKGDVAEGVRALLVDKDKMPNWKHKNLAEVTPEDIDAFFKFHTDENEHPLKHL